jgi:hypothetical protein
LSLELPYLDALAERLEYVLKTLADAEAAKGIVEKVRNLSR